MKLLSKIKRIFNGNTVRKKIVKYYFATMLIGALLLMLPFATLTNESLTFRQAFFSAASAFTDNGLSLVVDVETLSTFGHFVTLMLIQIGGIGIMAFKVFIFILIGKRLNITDRVLIFTEQSQSNLGGMVKLVKVSITTFVYIQLVIFVLLTIHFLTYYDKSILDALWNGIYYAISCTNSAGYSLSSNSLINYYHDYYFQTILMIGLFIGGIGFPIIYELNHYFKEKFHKRTYRLSMYLKLTMSAYFIISLVSFVLYGLSEQQTLLKDGFNLDDIYNVLFQVTSFRSAGFSTIDLETLSSSSHFLATVLMFIGVNPASTGGGIRTTTIAIIFVFIISSIKNGVKQPEVFNRRIGIETIKSAFIIFGFAFFLVSFVLVSILAQNDNFTFYSALIEAVSAFGTIGISHGITDDLSLFNQLLVVFAMIVGRVGVLGSLLMFTSKRYAQTIISLPEEDVIVG